MTWNTSSGEMPDGGVSHECTRFRTVLKRNKIRLIVACRQCGKRKIIATPHGLMAGPLRRLP